MSGLGRKYIEYLLRNIVSHLFSYQTFTWESQRRWSPSWASGPRDSRGWGTGGRWTWGPVLRRFSGELMIYGEMSRDDKKYDNSLTDILLRHVNQIIFNKIYYREVSICKKVFPYLFMFIMRINGLIHPVSNCSPWYPSSLTQWTKNILPPKVVMFLFYSMLTDIL